MFFSAVLLFLLISWSSSSPTSDTSSDSLLSSSSSSSSNQNTGWTCYNSNGKTPYKCVKALCGTKLNHNDAQSQCLSLGGTLLEIYSANDNNAAVNAIASNVSCTRTTTTTYWFGAISSYGLCYWYPTTQCRAEYMYNDWANAYPSNDDDCAVFNRDTSNNTKWTNSGCDTTKYYICQKLYATTSECNLTIASNCILRDGVTIHDIYISNLNLSPNITIKNTRLTNFTSNGSGFTNVTLSNSQLTDVLLQFSTFLNVSINNMTSNVVFMNNTSIKRSSFRDVEQSNYRLTSSKFEDSAAIQFNIYNSNHNNFSIINGSQMTNFTIINETLNGLTIAGSDYTDVYYENFNTIGSKVKNCTFTRFECTNIVRQKLNLTNINFTDVSLSNSQLINHNSSDVTLTQLVADNFDFFNVVFDNFEADSVDVINVNINNTRLDTCFSNVVNVYTQVWGYFFGYNHRMTVTQPMVDKIVQLCDYF